MMEAGARGGSRSCGPRLDVADRLVMVRAPEPGSCPLLDSRLRLGEARDGEPRGGYRGERLLRAVSFCLL
jgi:hypothetical protein